MPQNALLYRILIASPVDCDAERKLIPEVIHYWNAINSRATGIVLEPVLWETHATPEMGDRPQGIINRQLGETSDILIGTFWTRLGTQTGAAVSGTAEEIEEFRKAGKPVLLYFSDQPAALSTVDQDQLRALQEYRRQLSADGLLSTYTSLAELRTLLYRHLSNTIAQVHRSASQVIALEDDKQVEAVVGFRFDYGSFIRRLEAEWASERDSEPFAIAEGQLIVRNAVSELVNLRSRVNGPESVLAHTLDEALRRLRALQRYQLVMDGGVSFQRFWDEGTAIVELLKTAEEQIGT